jgi:tetratricopeptide (TPR) repeat protein
MELVHGVPITKYCDDNRLTPRQRLELLVPVCQAIQHAHQKGIIHRDIKPSNVMVTLYDGKPVPKVIDFGVAKATEQKLTERTLFTQYGTMVGTLEYMSPEQAEMSGLGADTRSDIFSLGVLLYELLTGSTPLSHKRVREAAYDEVLRMIREEEPPRPSTRLSDSGARLASIAAQRHMEPSRLTRLVRGELDWIVMKCLEKDRSRRYETASSLAQDIERYLADEPVQACPPSSFYRFRKFARRNKAALATGTVVALALSVAVAALVVSNIRIRGESAEKAKALQAATASQQESEESLKDALAAVDQMLTRVSEERLRDVPQMEPVRRDLLRDALKFYQKFLERRSSDPAIRRETALAYSNMAGLHLQLGDYSAAEAAYRRAFAMLDELSGQAPLEPAVRDKMVLGYLGFSKTLRDQGKLDEGQKALRRAVLVAEELLKEFPHSRLHQDRVIEARNRLAGALAAPTLLHMPQPTELAEAEQILERNLVMTEATTSFWDRAQTYQNLGMVRTKQRRLSEAEDAYRQAVELFDQALATSPSKGVRADLAGSLGQLARLVDANGRPEEAEQLYRRAMPMFDQFASDYPAGPHDRFGQAGAHAHHASLLKRLKRPAEAEQEFRRTVELQDKLAADFPALPGFRPTAVERRHQLAQFLAEAGRPEEAKEVYGLAAALLEELAAPEKSQALKRRCHFYAGLAEWDKAAADLTKAIELGSEDVLGVWYPLAVLHLRAGRTDEYRSLCGRLLKRLGPSGHEYIVIICKLAPDAVADLSQPVHIADKLVAREPENAEYLGLLGAALYRQGDLVAAIEKLEVAIRSGPEQGGIPWRKLTLAMAYHRLRRVKEAQRLFQEVSQWMEQNAEVKLSWAYRLDLQLFHREAEELLKHDIGTERGKSDEKEGAHQIPTGR